MKKKIILIIITLLIILLVVLILKNKNKNEKIKPVAKNENPLITSLKDERYFIKKNMNRYLKYAKKNQSSSEIIRDVNCNLDKKQYQDTEEANINQNSLTLVNKYYYLTQDYIPADLITLNAKYNTGPNNKLKKEAADAFMKMSDAALLDNVIIKNASGYRSYEYQVNLYNNYVNKDGKNLADKYSARPGFSEHQTGLCTDINQIDIGFEKTDAFKWLDKNAYKYGFILRFPKNKENLTGYQYEPWHYRYVGTSAAQVIKKENLTLEEYHAFYVNK